MELDHVEAFVAIVRRGGFSRAAATLHLSQPAISRRLRLLEHELGAPLFDRVRSGASLTDAGRAFLPHAEALLASMRDGVESVRALSGGDRGMVTLAVVGTLASTTLTERLRRFREAFPAIDLRVRTALSREVSELVRRGDATLGLRYEHDPHPELESRAIHDEPMVAVCSPHHRLAGVRQLRPAALAGERWITFPPRPAPGPEPYATLLQHRLAACGLGGAELIHIDSLTAQKRMVEAGFGLALLSASSVDEELRSGSLRALRAPALRATIPIVLIHRRRGYLSGAARALAAALSDWRPVSAPRPRPASARSRARSSGARAARAAGGRSPSRRSRA
jgi:DNA-binding transcriptional LysR family regulator